MSEKRSPIIKLLECKLMETEVAAKATRLAQIHPEKIALEEEAKQAAAQYKGRILALEAEAARLSAAVRTKLENRQVECIEIPRAEKGTVEIIRKDTGEVIDTRPMTFDERQDRLFSNFTELDFDDRTSTGDAQD